MESDLRALIELQTLDREIDRLREERAVIPKETEAQRGVVERAKKDLEDLRERLERVHVQRRTAEGELEAHRESVKKYEAQLYSIKTNKEYSALLHEIDEEKEAVYQLEEGLLGLMEETEELENLIAGRKLDLEKEEEAARKQQHAAVARLSETEMELGRHEGVRAGKAGDVPAALLEQYERVRRGLGGAVLVPMKDNSCQGCCMELRPQLLSELMGSAQLVTCERCSRLVYVEGDQVGE